MQTKTQVKHTPKNISINEDWTNDKHTALPWKIGEDQWTIEGKNWGNCWITVAKPYGENEQNRDANAQYIVKAVNCHEELVEALKRAIDIIDSQEVERALKMREEDYCNMLDDLNQALKKAGE